MLLLCAVFFNITVACSNSALNWNRYITNTALLRENAVPIKGEKGGVETRTRNQSNYSDSRKWYGYKTSLKFESVTVMDQNVELNERTHQNRDGEKNNKWLTEATYRCNDQGWPKVRRVSWGGTEQGGQVERRLSVYYFNYQQWPRRSVILFSRNENTIVQLKTGHGTVLHIVEVFSPKNHPPTTATC